MSNLLVYVRSCLRLLSCMLLVAVQDTHDARRSRHGNIFVVFHGIVVLDELLLQRSRDGYGYLQTQMR